MDKEPRNVNFISDELEQKLNSFNDKFMETLTQSLTKQLGFDLKGAVEKERRMTVGSSFVEPKKDFNFGKREQLSGKK